jgi:hypothetical protein
MARMSTAARRRAPARSGSSGTKLVSFHAPVRVHRPRVTKHVGLWGLLSSVFGLLTLLVDSVSLIVMLVIALSMTAVSSVVSPELPVRPLSPVVERSTTTRRKEPAKRSPAKARTGAKKTTKPGPKTPAKPQPKKGCTTPRCRTSNAPKDTCDCRCGGRLHGSAAPTRAEVLSPAGRRADRLHRERQRKAG